MVIKKVSLIGVCCDECNMFIEKGKTGYHRKNYYDEIFCSRICLEKHIIDNSDIRPITVKDLTGDEE